MVSKKPRIVIIGAGVAGLTAASKLHAFPKSRQLFELTVVEGGDRIGGRVSTASFCGDRIEQGATWIHGIDGSPVYDIARQTNSLHSDQPWECMDGPTHTPLTAAEGGHILGPSFVNPISDLFEDLMDFVQGKPASGGGAAVRGDEVLKHCAAAASGGGNLSVGAFLQKGLETYWAADGRGDEDGLVGNWSRRSLQRAAFAMHEGIQRTFTSADDLRKLDYNAEKDYVMFPGEEITIARGYSSVVDSLAYALPAGMIQLGRRVDAIEWRAGPAISLEDRPVKIRFADGSAVTADHVIVTVSLGVLKQGIAGDCSLFSPPLPDFKTRAISRLGYGVVDKVFLKLGPEIDVDGSGAAGFPYLQMLFHPPDSELRSPEIPEWIRKTSFLNPIYGGARVVVSWFTGPEALKLESLDEDEIISGFEATVSNLLPAARLKPSSCNGNGNIPAGNRLKFERVLRTQWGSNPLFLGSYSYVAVGSSIDDMDTLAEPLPKMDGRDGSEAPLLQILFAGEATHRTHYSTTHGAYFSGLREANRLLKHYNYNVAL